MIRRATLIVLPLLLLALSSSARAESGAEMLKRGISQYREASYASSVSALELSRASKQLSSQELAECDFYLGASYMALNSIVAAKREFAGVLTLQPEYELPQYTSPKVRALFAEVKQEIEHAPKLRPLAPVEAHGMLEISFDAPPGAYGALYYRCSGESTFAEEPLRHDRKRLTARIAARCPLIQYFAEARFADGLLHAGAENDLLEVTATMNKNAAPALALTTVPGANAPKDSWAKRHWWVWLTIGVAVGAGIGLGTYFGLHHSSAPTGSASFTFQTQQLQGGN